MPSLLTAKDFPRWTKGKLGLPADASLSEEIDRQIIRAEDHVRSVIGDDAYDDLAADGASNSTRRRRFEMAMHSLVEHYLHEAYAEHLGSQVGSSTQGKRSKTVAAEATRAATSAATRSYGQFVQVMFNLGHTVRQQAINFHYTTVTR